MERIVTNLSRLSSLCIEQVVRPGTIPKSLSRLYDLKEYPNNYVERAPNYKRKAKGLEENSKVWLVSTDLQKEGQGPGTR